MNKKLMVIPMLFLIVLMASCSPAVTTPTTAAVQPATVAAATQTPYFVVVTATPDQNQTATATSTPALAATATTAPTATLAPTKPAAVLSTSSTPRNTAVPPTPKIYIYKGIPAGDGTVALYWTAKGSTFDNGFLILYATDPANLVYGEARSVAVTDGKYRVFTMTGTYHYTYYFKICRFTGTNCDYGSNVFGYTFTGPN
jgi:hypothetical protein